MADRMSLNALIDTLIDLRAKNPHLAEMDVYVEDAELGVEFGSSILGVSADGEGTNLRITNL